MNDKWKAMIIDPSKSFGTVDFWNYFSINAVATKYDTDNPRINTFSIIV